MEGNGVQVVTDPKERAAVLSNALMPLYANVLIYDVIQPPEKIYYRVYKKGDEHAALLLYYWSFQAFPPHPGDYAPVIVILDGNLVPKEVYYDRNHYKVGRFANERGSPELWLFVKVPWRSMEVKYPEDAENDELYPLYFQIYPYDEYKERDAGTELVHLTDDVLQELRSKRVNPINIHDRIIRDPWSIRRAKTWSVYGDWTILSLAWDTAKNWGIKLPSRRKLSAEPVAS